MESTYITNGFDDRVKIYKPADKLITGQIRESAGGNHTLLKMLIDLVIDWSFAQIRVYR